MIESHWQVKGYLAHLVTISLRPPGTASTHGSAAVARRTADNPALYGISCRRFYQVISLHSRALPACSGTGLEYVYV